MDSVIKKLIRSYNASPVNKTEDILEWIEQKNKEIKVNICKNKLSDSNDWFYDETSGVIRNRKNSFFQIKGMRHYNDGELTVEQPILLQREIGYLGIICKEINGVIHLLMQAKIEPGNINKIQLSPTVQATKSNFTQLHGGKKPAYIDYFLNADKHTVIFDQIQSEQSSRFLGKRNRNIMILVEEEVPLLPSHMWITLGQLKELMKIDNLVNMDTRTVISCIPFSEVEISGDEREELGRVFSDIGLFNSIFSRRDSRTFKKIYRYMNDYKMLYSGENRLVPLKELSGWDFHDDEIVCKNGYPFKVVFADIEIEGREVTRWTQPLFEAVGMATFGLFSADFDGKTYFLVHALHEAGCFDEIELAPTVQLEAGRGEKDCDSITTFFFDVLKDGKAVRNDVILSEEGGRFYHEQNRNIVLKVSAEIVPEIPKGYFWADFGTLNEMVQYNNVLNIQLRNLLSLLEF